MRRREFIGVLGGAATWPSLAARTQSQRRFRLGFVSTGAPDQTRPPGLKDFTEALRQLGYVDHQNLEILARFAEGDPRRLREFASELVSFKVDAILLQSAGEASIFHDYTHDIPIVAWSAGDLEGSGLVQSLRRPGGNVTGIQTLAPDLMTKRLQLLNQIVPALTSVGFIKPITPTGLITNRYVDVTTNAAKALGVELVQFEAHVAEEFRSVFDVMARRGIQAALVISNPLSGNNRVEIAAAAAEVRIPTMYEARDFVVSGGLIAYGVVRRDFPRLAAGILDQIFKGNSPAEIPVQQASKFELTLNLKAAGALGLQVPPTVLALADEVIE
jgi:putative tryptophan/tyrosine transport system substrate-binding protein